MRGPRLGFRERQETTIGASRMAARAWLRRGVVTVIASIFLAVSGAFGSGGVNVWSRFAFWVLGIGAGSAIGGGVAEARERFGWPREGLASFTFIAAATAVPTTIVIGLLDAVLFGGGQLGMRLLGQVAIPVFVITLAMTALNALADRQPVVTRAAMPETSVDAPVSRVVRARLLDRLPARLAGGEFWAVEAEDHYLRVHTSRGSDLILLRLADAMSELEGIEGAQTHRSWWVARDALEGARRVDGRATLLLKGGVEAPVSRTYARALRAAAWF